MSDADAPAVRTRAAQPINEAVDTARKLAEDARTQELIRVSAEHARVRRSTGHFSQAELTSLVEAIERDLETGRHRHAPRDPSPTGLERRRSDNAPKS
jgi:hypothetical protein